MQMYFHCLGKIISIRGIVFASLPAPSACDLEVPLRECAHVLPVDVGLGQWSVSRCDTRRGLEWPGSMLRPSAMRPASLAPKQKRWDKRGPSGSRAAQLDPSRSAGAWGTCRPVSTRIKPVMFWDCAPAGITVVLTG